MAGALNAVGLLSLSAKYVIQFSFPFAVISYAIALAMAGGFGFRPLKVRIRAFGAGWFVLGVGQALGAEGLTFLLAIVAAVSLARSVIKDLENTPTNL